MAKAKNILSFGVLLFLLVGAPVVSFFYLRKGYDYRKTAIMVQEDYGKMPDLSRYSAIRGGLPDSLRGAMTVVGWLDDDASPQVRTRYGLMLDSLYQQFAASPNLYFTTLVNAEDATQTVAEFTERYHLPEDDMLSFLTVNDAEFQRSADEFRLPFDPRQRPVVALVDSSLTVVKHYDLTNRDEAIGLVQLISLIIPLPEKPSVVIKRKNEL